MIRFGLFVFTLLAVFHASALAFDSLRVAPPLRIGIPSHFDSAQATRLLTRKLSSLLQSKPMRGSSVSASVISVSDGTSLFDHNGTQPLTPASTSKLFSTASVFYFEGKGASVNTELRYDGAITGEVLNGDVYLVGNGDAMLTTPDLEFLADRLMRVGVRTINGNIIADGFRFDDDPIRSRYSGDGEVVQPLPPITALTVNDGVISVLVTNVGGRVSAQTIPSSALCSVVIAGTKGRLRIAASTNAHGRTTYTVSGSPGLNRTASRSFVMPRPALGTAGIFASRLQSGGITFSGEILERPMPQTAKLLAVFKRPFVGFASVVNKRSHNYLAEHCFMMAGAHCGEYVRTASRAKRAIIEVLDSLHVPLYGVAMNDGSGLSRRNLSAAVTQVHLLRSAYLQPWGSEFRSTLAIAGRDGSLRNRMIGTKAENNCVGKTGTLRNVSALSGFVRTADGKDLAFALIANGPSVRTYKAVENAFVTTLAEFRFDKVANDSLIEVVESDAADADAFTESSTIGQKSAVPAQISPKQRLNAEKVQKAKARKKLGSAKAKTQLKKKKKMKRAVVSKKKKASTKQRRRR